MTQELVTHKEAEVVVGLCRKLIAQAHETVKLDGEPLNDTELTNIEGMENMCERLLEEHVCERAEAEWILELLRDDLDTPARAILSRICAN
jgi:hypothetical protein